MKKGVGFRVPAGSSGGAQEESGESSGGAEEELREELRRSSGEARDPGGAEEELRRPWGGVREELRKVHHNKCVVMDGFGARTQSPGGENPSQVTLPSTEETPMIF